MRKKNVQKLTLSRETVRSLESGQVSLAQGGAQPLTSPSVCFSGNEDCCISR